MARLQIIYDGTIEDIPDRALPALRKQAFAYNAQAGLDLTLEQYLARHLREMAITEDLAAAFPNIQNEVQEETQQRMNTARDELIANLDS